MPLRFCIATVSLGIFPCFSLHDRRGKTLYISLAGDIDSSMLTVPPQPPSWAEASRHSSGSSVGMTRVWTVASPDVMPSTVWAVSWVAFWPTSFSSRNSIWRVFLVSELASDRGDVAAGVNLGHNALAPLSSGDWFRFRHHPGFARHLEGGDGIGSKSQSAPDRREGPGRGAR